MKFCRLNSSEVLRGTLQRSRYGDRSHTAEVGMDILAEYRSDLEQGPASLLPTCRSSRRVQCLLEPRKKWPVHPEATSPREFLHGAPQPGLVTPCGGDRVLHVLWRGGLLPGSLMVLEDW